MSRVEEKARELATWIMEDHPATVFGPAKGKDIVERAYIELGLQKMAEWVMEEVTMLGCDETPPFVGAPAWVHDAERKLFKKEEE